MGEDTAVSLLRRMGYKILQRNYKCSIGEVDIVAFEDKNVVIVEVKASIAKGVEDIYPEDRINAEKKRKLRKIAEYYRLEKKVRYYAMRFDTVALVFGPDKKLLQSRVDKNAFTFDEIKRG